MLALNKTNGMVAWKWSPSDIGGYQDSYATPTLVRSGDRNDLVLAVSREIWAFDPEKGGINWYAYTCLLYTSPSPRDATLSRMPSSA